jgi:hypothetical protein
METRAADQQQKDSPVLYTEDGEKCILGQAEKHATRQVTVYLMNVKNL